MSSIPRQPFPGGFLRSRLTIEDDGRSLTFHHFARDPAGAIFGTLWLGGWMFGMVVIARGSPWPWPAHDLLILAAMLGIWFLAGYCVLAALVQYNRLIVTPDSITYTEQVLFYSSSKSIALSDVKEVSLQQKPRRGGPYDVIVVASRSGRRPKAIRFGDGLDRPLLIDCTLRIQQRVEEHYQSAPTA